MKNTYRMWWLGLMLGSVFSLPAGAALVEVPGRDGILRDTVLNIYWLQDASLGGGMGRGAPQRTGPTTWSSQA